MGRRSKLTPEVAERIVDALCSGATLEAAAGAGGIGRTTLHRWLNEGEAAEQSRLAAELSAQRRVETAEERRKRDFWNASTRARDEAHVRFATLLMKRAEEGDTRAIMFWLERRHPDEWGRRERHPVASGPADYQAPDLAELVAGDPGVLDAIDALRDRLTQYHRGQDGA